MPAAVDQFRSGADDAGARPGLDVEPGSRRSLSRRGDLRAGERTTRLDQPRGRQRLEAEPLHRLRGDQRPVVRCVGRQALEHLDLHAECVLLARRDLLVRWAEAHARVEEVEAAEVGAAGDDVTRRVDLAGGDAEMGEHGRRGDVQGRRRLDALPSRGSRSLWRGRR